ncbi:MAG TPA: ABC transporter ATP-binding protein [Tissierellales bacterium]|nr:ABC transporter ATP-binding protein [Tissierellales bacterium]
MKDVKKILPFTKGYAGLYLLGILAVIISQLFNTLGPLIIGTAVDSVIGDKAASSAIAGSVIQFLGGREVLRDSLWIIGAIIVLNTVLRGIFLYLKGYLSVKSAEDISMKIRNSLYDHIQKLPYSYHVKADTGDLIQRCTSDVETIKRFLSVQLIEVAGSLFMLLFILQIMLRLNISMALVSVALLPFTFAFALIFFRRVQKDFKEADESEARLTTTLQENLTGIRVVKAFAREAYELGKFDIRNSEYRVLVNKLIMNLAMYWSVSDFISMLQVGLTIVVGTWMVVQGNLTLGVLISFISYVNMMVWPVRQLGRTLTDMGKTTVSIKRIDELFSTPVEVLVENGEEPEVHGNIEFRDVSFSYEKDRMVLDHISFSVEKGQTLAIIGSTGSGKSSLVHLLPRLYDYDDGSIKIDGRELKSIDRQWVRKNVGLVLQEPFLYAKTIKENIRLTDPTKEDNTVFTAAKTASIHNDIQSFDKKYDTLVGERGVSLSGGQKQRMSIARTIISETPIVIFDDSLSAVDTETDVQIRRALSARRNKSTTIIISHRISTVSEADIILVMDKGKIVQKGTHEELINTEGLYKRVYEIQSSIDEDLEAV